MGAVECVDRPATLPMWHGDYDPWGQDGGCGCMVVRPPTPAEKSSGAALKRALGYPPIEELFRQCALKVLADLCPEDSG